MAHSLACPQDKWGTALPFPSPSSLSRVTLAPTARGGGLGVFQLKQIRSTTFYLKIQKKNGWRNRPYSGKTGQLGIKLISGLRNLPPQPLSQQNVVWLFPYKRLHGLRNRPSYFPQSTKGFFEARFLFIICVLWSFLCVVFSFGLMLFLAILMKFLRRTPCEWVSPKWAQMTFFSRALIVFCRKDVENRLIHSISRHFFFRRCRQCYVVGSTVFGLPAKSSRGPGSFWKVSAASAPQVRWRGNTAASPALGGRPRGKWFGPSASVSLTRSPAWWVPAPGERLAELPMACVATVQKQVFRPPNVMPTGFILGFQSSWGGCLWGWSNFFGGVTLWAFTAWPSICGIYFVTACFLP